MKLNRFVQRDKPSPLHSSGFVQSSDRIGSTSVNPFSKRLQNERSRRMVGGYRDARVLRQARYENQDNRPASYSDAPAPPDFEDQSQLNSQSRGSRIDIVRPIGQGSSPSVPQRANPQQHVFREPPSRHRQ